ncbi:hypothetical protein B0H15DRAFT_950984 [Mycena belliarum]|uniref:Uncharacterized protein n=1 Tax=Mycena belliarum TaxID=1033014 RepID=A0AAD6U1R8_9AGAR|nr:hypothetical protein B0H15DRAFT_950984 [Mycena belliae]
MENPTICSAAFPSGEPPLRPPFRFRFRFRLRSPLRPPTPPPLRPPPQSPFPPPLPPSLAPPPLARSRDPAGTPVPDTTWPVTAHGTYARHSGCSDHPAHVLLVILGDRIPAAGYTVLGVLLPLIALPSSPLDLKMRAYEGRLSILSTSPSPRSSAERPMHRGITMEPTARDFTGRAVKSYGIRGIWYAEHHTPHLSWRASTAPLHVAASSDVALLASHLRGSSGDGQGQASAALWLLLVPAVVIFLCAPPRWRRRIVPVTGGRDVAVVCDDDDFFPSPVTNCERLPWLLQLVSGPGPSSSARRRAYHFGAGNTILLGSVPCKPLRLALQKRRSTAARCGEIYEHKTSTYLRNTRIRERHNGS